MTDAGSTRLEHVFERPGIRLLLRCRYVVVSAAMAVCVMAAWTPRNDWTEMAWASDLLLGRHRVMTAFPFFPHLPGGFHLFGNYRFLQMGPASLIIAAGLRRIGPHEGQYAAVMLIAVVGVAAVFVLERAWMHRWGSSTPASWVRLTVLLGGLVLAPSWAELAGRYSHLDDAMALGLVIVAVWAIEREHPMTTGVALGLAAASKAWAIGFAPLVLAFSSRDRARAAFGVAVPILVAWLPFVALDSHTLQASDFPSMVVPSTPLAILGVHNLSHPGLWRLFQFGAEASAVVLMVRKGGWESAAVVCVAARLVLDPFDYSYYTTALVPMALAFDVLMWRRPVPALALMSTGGLLSHSALLTTPASRGVVRLTTYVVVVVVAVAAVSFRSAQTRPSAREPQVL